MVSIVSLWLPILLSAAVVFILSSLIHMVLGYHKNDYVALPDEQQVMDDLRKANLATRRLSFSTTKRHERYENT